MGGFFEGGEGGGLVWVFCLLACSFVCFLVCLACWLDFFVVGGVVLVVLIFKLLGNRININSTICFVIFDTTFWEVAWKNVLGMKWVN